jgi:thiamine pyrophosphokinase
MVCDLSTTSTFLSEVLRKLRKLGQSFDTRRLQHLLTLSINLEDYEDSDNLVYLSLHTFYHMINNSMPISYPNSKLWKPAAFADGQDHPETPYVVIVLNLPIQNAEIFSTVVAKAQAVIAADGGANRIKDLYEDDSGYSGSRRLPDAIVGDLDSLLPKTQTYFEQKGVTLHKEPDQYSTDFTKCLRYISEQRQKWIRPSSASLDTIVFGGLGGRADQAFAQLHQLYTANQDPTIKCGDIYLYSEESIIFMLYKGMNMIETPLGLDTLGENVGIIPLAKPAVVSTTGLEWDVSDWETSFGTQVSTSNHIRDSEVTVTTNERILFTVELARKPSHGLSSKKNAS